MSRPKSSTSVDVFDKLLRENKDAFNEPKWG